MAETRTCKHCNGTGLFTGAWWCKDGTAEVCCYCNGEGRSVIVEGIRRVFPYQGELFTGGNRRILFPEAHTFENGTTVHYENYGCTYEEWLQGKEPIPFE